MSNINEVAVYSDNDFSKEIVGFNIMSIKVRSPSRVTQAPIESGETSTDYKVRMPTQISVTGFVNCHDVSGESALRDLDGMLATREYKFFSVATKGGLYNNLVLQDCPHDEDPDHVEVVQFHLEFIEARIVQGAMDGTASGDNSSTKNRGYIG